MSREALKATIHSPAFSSVAHNSRVVLSIQDTKDEKFWKAICCLLRAVFPDLKALQYCDANYLAMDKIYYLVHRANDAILMSALDFDDVDLFRPMQVTELNGIDLEMTAVNGEKLEFERYYLCLLSDFNLFVLTFFLFSVKTQMKMTQMKMTQMKMTHMTTKSVLVKLCTCHGITVLTGLSMNMLSLSGFFLWCLKSMLAS